MNDSNEINLWTGGWLLGAPIWLILNGIELLDKEDWLRGAIIIYACSVVVAWGALKTLRSVEKAKFRVERIKRPKAKAFASQVLDLSTTLIFAPLVLLWLGALLVLGLRFLNWLFDF